MRLVLVLLAAISMAGSAFAAEDAVRDVDTGRYQRHYVLHLPTHLPANPDSKMPLVLVMGDAGMDGAAALKRYRWDELADADGFVAAGLTPLAIDPDRPDMFQTNPLLWNDGTGRGAKKRGDVDEAAYARAVIEDVKARVAIDPKRIFIAGFANGGAAAQAIALKLSDRLAAVASVAGHQWTEDASLFPLSTLLIYGDHDPVEPMAGGAGVNLWTHGAELRPKPDHSAEAWVKALHCSHPPATSTPLSRLAQTEWTGCDGNVVLDYVVIDGLGHHWPGGQDDQWPESETGPTLDRVDGTAFIWKWFAAHPKP